MGDAFLGIDIGTSAVKALALDAEGTILASGSAAYGIELPRPGWTQQDPADWIAGAQAAVAEVLAVVPAARIACIGLSGQMHGLTPVDASGAVIRPAILWNDQRNAAEADEIMALAGGPEALAGMTNNRMLIGYTGGKILWMARHEPALFARVAHALNPKDYLRLVLTGEIATEVSDASGTGLFDVRARAWSGALLDRLPFDRKILPPAHESAEVTGRVSARAAAAFGLAEGTPVIGGGGDAVIQSLGAGVIAPGVVQTTIGTAGVVAAALDRAADNPGGRLQLFCNVAPDLWHVMGVSMNAGFALSWWRGISGAADFDALVAEAASAPPGAEGLLFLPYLNGERCPHPDPDARGAFVGLSARHTRAHLSRAVMEGVTHALGDMLALMRAMGVEGTEVKASGGGARSAMWRQMQADLMGAPVTTTRGASEGGAFGAALLAGVAAGAWPDAATAAGVCTALTRDDPDPARAAPLQAAHEVYRGLYAALSDTTRALAALRA